MLHGLTKDDHGVIGFVIGKVQLLKKNLYGIALKLGKDLGEECNPKAALQALEKHPEIEQRFRDTFPFIDF